MKLKVTVEIDDKILRAYNKALCGIESCCGCDYMDSYSDVCSNRRNKESLSKEVEDMLKSKTNKKRW